MKANKFYGPLFNVTDTVFCNMITLKFNISRKDYGRFMLLHRDRGWWGEPHEALMYFLLQEGDIKALVRTQPSTKYYWYDRKRQNLFLKKKHKLNRRRAPRKALIEEEIIK
jgi:hypothetical protein